MPMPVPAFGAPNGGSFFTAAGRRSISGGSDRWFCLRVKQSTPPFFLASSSLATLTGVTTASALHVDGRSGGIARMLEEQ